MKTKMKMENNRVTDVQSLKMLVRSIVKQAAALKDKYITVKNIKDAPVNYACIFAHSIEEYKTLLRVTFKLGKVIKETPTGLIFRIPPLPTVAGSLKLLKIRLPDSSRSEWGDADFTISRYPEFKKKYLFQKGFGLINRETYEIIELVDDRFNVRTYFSHPPLDKLLGLT